MSYRVHNLTKAREAKQLQGATSQLVVKHNRHHVFKLQTELAETKSKLDAAQETILNLRVEIIQHHTIQWMCKSLIPIIQNQIILAKLRLCEF